MNDTAVRVFYPMAAQVARQVNFEPGKLPKYGGVGVFGIQGLADGAATALQMGPADGAYDFQKGKIYNLESSKYIAKMDGASGAHSDIAGPEVANAIWTASLASA